MSNYLKPCEEFICDHCKNIIKIDDGNIVYKFNNIGYEDFKIVHRGKCDTHYNNIGYSWSNLKDYLPLDYKKLSDVLSLLDVGAIIDNNDKFETFNIPGKNIRSWTELMRRLYIPYYEEAIKYKNVFINLRNIEEQNETSIFEEKFLKKVIDEGKNI